MRHTAMRAKRIITIGVVLGLLLVATLLLRAPSYVAAQNIGGIGLAVEQYEDGFTQVTDIANAGDERLFIVERTGAIKIIDGGAQTMPTPFLTLPADDVCTGPYQSGLLGLAFHPDYSANGYFFIHYVTPRDGVSCKTVDNIIARFKVSATDPNIADPASEQVVLRVEHIVDDNFGGDLTFGPLDGYLYIPIGDGGGPRNPAGPAQDLTSILGKILRIDVSTAEAGPMYTIPADNPYVGTPNAEEEIWALGLRNPWRISFDSFSGDLYVSDVGEVQQEEINFASSTSEGGENYGWPCYEGTFMHPDGTCTGELVTPIFTGTHGTGGFTAITGGFVYRGSDYPLLRGYYIFSDIGSADLYTLVRDTNGEWQSTVESDLLPTGASTFGEAANGELYLSTYTFESDIIYHVTDTRPQTHHLYMPLIRHDE